MEQVDAVQAKVDAVQAACAGALAPLGPDAARLDVSLQALSEVRGCWHAGLAQQKQRLKGPMHAVCTPMPDLPQAFEPSADDNALREAVMASFNSQIVQPCFPPPSRCARARARRPARLLSLSSGHACCWSLHAAELQCTRHARSAWHTRAHICHARSRRLEARPYGSFVSGFYTPSSDLDLALDGDVALELLPADVQQELRALAGPEALTAPMVGVRGRTRMCVRTHAHVPQALQRSSRARGARATHSTAHTTTACSHTAHHHSVLATHTTHMAAGAAGPRRARRGAGPRGARAVRVGHVPRQLCGAHTRRARAPHQVRTRAWPTQCACASCAGLPFAAVLRRPTHSHARTRTHTCTHARTLALQHTRVRARPPPSPQVHREREQRARGRVLRPGGVSVQAPDHRAHCARGAAHEAAVPPGGCGGGARGGAGGGAAGGCAWWARCCCCRVWVRPAGSLRCAWPPGVLGARGLALQLAPAGPHARARACTQAELRGALAWARPSLCGQGEALGRAVRAACRCCAAGQAVGQGARPE